MTFSEVANFFKVNCLISIQDPGTGATPTTQICVCHVVTSGRKSNIWHLMVLLKLNSVETSRLVQNVNWGAHADSMVFS